MKDINPKNIDFKKILETMADGITIQDKTGRIIFANKVAAKISGFTTVEEFLKTSTQEIVKKFDGKDIIGNAYNLENFPGRQILKGKNYAEDLVGFTYTKKKTENWAIIKSTPIKKNGKLELVINVFHDITEEKKEDQQRDVFMAMTSHELKSLLTSIKAYGQLLQKRVKDVNNLNYLVRLDNQVNKLTSFILDLLDLSRIQAGTFKLNKEKLNMDNLFKDIISDLQITTINKKIVLRGVIGKEILADRSRISEVIVNFINNAIKYDPNSKKINILLKKVGDLVKVSVTDYGIGIKKSDQNKIFNLFYQSNSNNSRKEGLGLGLYLSKKIIEAHGGKIGVESTYGKGSTFYFEIPITS